MSRLCSAIVLIVLAWSRPVGAASVVLVRPPNPSAEATETLSRLHGELVSVGLEVALSDRPATDSDRADALAWLEQLLGERGADAVVDFVGEDVLVAVDVWIKKPPRRFEVTRVAVEPNTTNPSERLALRASEALRGSLLEIDLAARQRREAEPQPDPAAQAQIDQPEIGRERFSLEMGAAALMSFDSVGPAVLPLVRAAWAASPSVLLQATLAGLGSRAMVATTIGKAQVAQQYGILSASYRFRSDRRLWPFVGLGAGVLRTAIEGETGLGTVGHSASQWSFLLDGSLGAGLRLHSRWYLSLGAHVQLAEPYVAIRLLDDVAATTGRPNLLLTLAMGAWL